VWPRLIPVRRKLIETWGALREFLRSSWAQRAIQIIFLHFQVQYSRCANAERVDPILRDLVPEASQARKRLVFAVFCGALAEAVQVWESKSFGAERELGTSLVIFRGERQGRFKWIGWVARNCHRYGIREAF
jgi:hypothetical protein